MAVGEDAPLNEKKEERRERLERERKEALLRDTLSSINKLFFDKKSWGTTAVKWAGSKIKHSRNSITVDFDPKTADEKHPSPRSTAFTKMNLLPGRAYRITFWTVSDGAEILVKEEENGKFNTLASGLTTWPNFFKIPEGHRGNITIEVVNTALNSKTTIEMATLEVISDEESKIAGL